MSNEHEQLLEKLVDDDAGELSADEKVIILRSAVILLTHTIEHLLNKAEEEDLDFVDGTVLDSMAYVRRVIEKTDPKPEPEPIVVTPDTLVVGS